MAKKRMPKYGIMGILSAILDSNFAKYQYFSMKPSLFDKFYQLTYSLQFVVQFYVKCGFYTQKTIKKPQKCHFLDLRFFESACHVLDYNSGYVKYFSIFIFRVTKGNSADTNRAGFLS